MSSKKASFCKNFGALWKFKECHGFPELQNLKDAENKDGKFHPGSEICYLFSWRNLTI
jgi:hypothetical protein